MNRNELLGIDEVLKLIEQNKSKKLFALIENKRVETGALKEICSIQEGMFFETICKNYRFSEIFDSISDFIRHKSFYDIASHGYIGYVSNWIDCFYESPEQLMEDYNFLQKDYKKVQLYRFLCQPNGYSDNSIPEAFAKGYKDCISAICHIFKQCDVHSYSANDRIKRFVRASHFLDIETLLEVQQIFCSTVDINSLLQIRVESRIGKLKYKTDLIELMSIIDYVIEKNKTVDYERLTWILACVENRKLNSELKPTLKYFYKKYLAPIVNSNTIQEVSKEYGMFNFSFVFGFEENEDVLNNAFDFMIYHGEGRMATKRIQMLLKNNWEDLIITDSMTRSSRVWTDNWQFMLLNKKIEKAEQIFEWGSRGRSVIEPFGDNPVVTRYFKIDEMEDAEFEKLSSLFLWDYINEYFDDRTVPFNFAIKHMDKITDRSFICGRTGDKYSSEQLYTVISKSKDLTTKKVLVNDIFSKEDATNEIVAKALEKIDYNFGDSLIPFSLDKGNANLDLKSILTLL